MCAFEFVAHTNGSYSFGVAACVHMTIEQSKGHEEREEDDSLTLVVMKQLSESFVISADSAVMRAM